MKQVILLYIDIWLGKSLNPHCEFADSKSIYVNFDAIAN